jgi:hypothetical protein
VKDLEEYWFKVDHDKSKFILQTIRKPLKNVKPIVEIKCIRANNPKAD